MSFPFFAAVFARLEFLFERLAERLGAGNQTIVFDGEAENGGADTADFRIARDESDLRQGDTLDLSGETEAVRVDLDTGNQGTLAPRTGGGLTEDGSVTIGEQVTPITDFENVIGGSGNDTIFGNAQNNVLLGGAGDDRLHPFAGDDFVDGGSGIDTLLLNGFPTGSKTDLEAGISTFIDGSSGTNRIANIENVTGSVVAGDDLLGDDGANVLNGQGGNDRLFGGAGDDTLIGGDNGGVTNGGFAPQGDNADVLRGGEGADQVTGGAGADQFLYADGEGGDTIDFSAAEGDVFVLDSESFGVSGSFQNVARTADDDVDAGLVGLDTDNDVFVLQGVWRNAGEARNAILDGGVEDAFFFVYYNVNLDVSRLFHVDEDGGLQQLANIGTAGGLTDEGGNPINDDAAIAALTTFEADNFVLDDFDTVFG
ncbi:MAG: M10 family metallopeptidase C-terminal domain-containing protein [Pseudomonadota bacterium]